MKDRDTIEALEACLELLEEGSAIEACLTRYPELAGELEPMLRLAVQTRRVGESIAPRAAAQRAGLGRITDAWAQRQARRAGRWSGFRPLAKSWAVATIAALVLVFGGWTTSSVAAESVPGEVLYPVKKAQERFLLFVSFSDRRKAELHAKFAEERTEEIEKLATQGRSQIVVDRTAERMANHTRKAVTLMGGVLPEPPLRDAGQTAPGIRVTLDPSTELIRVSKNKLSRERFVMQERFLRQFRHFQELEQRLAHEMQPTQRERMERAFLRSQELLRRAILAMKALEESQPRHR